MTGYTKEQSTLRCRTQRQAYAHHPVLYDRMLVWLTLVLMALGLVMVTSASMPLSQHLLKDPFLFAKQHAAAMALALLASLITLQIPMRIWQQLGIPLLMLSMLLLLLVLIMGNTVNGASRWLTIGPLRIQPAEFAKLSLFAYLSGYLVRKAQVLRAHFWDFCKPLVIMLLLALLLLAQPDLGTVIVLFITSLVLLFLAGARGWQLLAVIGSGAVAVALLIALEPYRVRRVVAFLNPWCDPYGSGYQLTQSLMAFGRGECFGQGLGNAIQKLGYLPAAHTDFILAVVAEELGYFGVVVVLSLLALLIARALRIGYQALKAEQRFCGFFACAIAIWLSAQVLINVGGTIGVIPTKGLTLPFISYGGSSLLGISTAIVILLRIDFELRCSQAQAYTLGTKSGQ